MKLEELAYLIWDWKTLIWIYLVIQLLGIATAIKAIISTRTSQGAIAWAISLTLLPVIALPFYWIFGRRKFHGYIELRRKGNLELSDVIRGLIKYIPNHQSELPYYDYRFKALENLVSLPFTKGNSAKLLINGEATFKHIFEAISEAQNYVIVQFYIWRHEGIGAELKQLLIDKAQAGVKIYALFDEVGSHALEDKYIAQLRQAGVLIYPFKSTKGKSNRFQLNFRNHRKLVIVDGKKALIGGINLGDEYRGLQTKFKAWRDTHIEIAGPSTICLQVSFVEDWYWATKTVPVLNWTPTVAVEPNVSVMAVPSGPSDEWETCALFFINLINVAQNRIWMATPYFVPDQQLLSALTLAVLRGVDVRLITPIKSDNKLIGWATYQFAKTAQQIGIKCYRYREGFMHQKVLLVDEDISMVGTSNLDNRSFRLNFEVNMLMVGKEMNKKVELMLEQDFEHSRDFKPKKASWWSNFLKRVAMLFSPIM